MQDLCFNVLLQLGISVPLQAFSQLTLQSRCVFTNLNVHTTLFSPKESPASSSYILFPGLNFFRVQNIGVLFISSQVFDEMIINRRTIGCWHHNETNCCNGSGTYKLCPGATIMGCTEPLVDGYENHYRYAPVSLCLASGGNIFLAYCSIA